ncbi:MAG: outer membrane beta-barrel protein [Akkermansia sp.]|nr:outer membrane beta-barrel protein [Akkermansia sp.]
MKKLLSTLTILATLAGAASAAPYVLPENQPGAYTVYDWTPVYSVDALYAIGDENDTPDMWGARLSLNLYSQQRASVRHQFSLNVAYLTGEEKHTMSFGQNETYSYKNDMYVLPITFGYDVNLAVTDEVSFYLGGKAGYSIGEAKIKVPGYGSDKLKTDGFTFTVGGGLKVQCSQQVYVKLGYEFGRTYADDNGKFNFGQHIISLGVGCEF